MNHRILFAAAILILAGGLTARAAIEIIVGHNGDDDAAPGFVFKNVPFPSDQDAATHATFAIVDGEKEPNGGGLDKLNDGKLPTEEDQNAENFYFKSGTPGGRLEVDLGSVIDIKQVNTYSWHPSTRGPQVYKLYAGDGTAPGFNPAPPRETDPASCGWKLIAQVDTRAKNPQDNGGQYGVSISDPAGLVGSYRYLLFDIAITENEDPWGNTYYSEIDVVDAHAPALTTNPNAPVLSPDSFTFPTDDGKCQITFNADADPGMEDWARGQLAPVLAQWYPKIVALLPSSGYVAPTHYTITIKPFNGVAYTVGTNITLGQKWLETTSPTDAVGCLVHESVHIVQRFGKNRYSTLSPGWLVEGSADYVRWFLFEPQSHGADIEWLRGQTLPSIRYDGSYRMSANFLNWVAQNYDKDIVVQMDAIMRQDKYRDSLWKQYTGKTVHELGAEWRKYTLDQLAASDP
jgi:hypothetical protein